MVMRKITGDDGKATFEVPYGDYNATIKKNGYATVNKEIAFRSNHKNFTEPLYVGGMATFNVYGMFGMNNVPVENATVTATTSIGGEDVSFTGTTNVDGECKISMPYCSSTVVEYDVTATCDGFTFDNPMGFDFHDGNTSTEVYMTPSTATVTINVVDGQGEPISAQGGLILKADENINFEFEAENGTATIEDVYYGTYLFGCLNRDSETSYFCELIVDGETETVNATLQDTTYTLTINDEITGTSLYNVYYYSSINDSGDNASFVEGVAQCTDLYGFYDYNICTYDSQTIPNEHWIGGAKSILIDENKSISYDAIRDVTINFVDENGNIISDMEEPFTVGFDSDNSVYGYANGGQGFVDILDGTYEVHFEDGSNWQCNATITIDATHTVFNIIATEKQTNNGSNDPLVEVTH